MPHPPRLATELAERSFKRILLIKPSSLGDVVHALPVLHGLRMRYPDARIDWLISSAFAPLLESHNELNELIIFDRRYFGRVGRSPQATRGFVRFVQGLRARRYELVIDLQGLFRTGFLAWASGAPVRIGFYSGREAAWIFFTHRIRDGSSNMHAVDRNYSVSKLLGFEGVPIRFNLPVSDVDYDDARTVLRDAGLQDGEPVVVVVPGARWETKRWPPERFAEAVDEIHARRRGRCVLAGGSEEVGLCERIVGLCRSAPVSLAGRTSLPQLAALLGLADLVLCHDSAAMHLAVALERPLVCLVGPTNPLRTGPYRRTDDVVRLKLDCAPCYLRRLSRCPHDHRCMRALDTASVVAAVERALLASAGVAV